MVEKGYNAVINMTHMDVVQPQRSHKNKFIIVNTKVSQVERLTARFVGNNIL